MDPLKYKVSEGFINGIINGKDGFEKMSPILEIAVPFNGNPWSLSDGSQTIGLNLVIQYN